MLPLRCGDFSWGHRRFPSGKIESLSGNRAVIGGGHRWYQHIGSTAPRIYREIPSKKLDALVGDMSIFNPGC
jgi:hypothetical protein